MNLKLDPRQRAMLQEMHLQVWLPAEQTEAADGAPPVSAVQAARPVKPDASTQPPPEAARAAPAANAPPLAMQPHIADLQGMGWAALQQAVADCRACALHVARRHTVFGMGGLRPAKADLPPVVDWLFVGEAPGEQEDLSGRPFVGPAGQLLDNMLKAIGLDRGNEAPAALARSAQGVYIANVLKCRPPGNRNPESAEVAQCLPYLQRQIELLQPKIIVALGRFAAQALLHETLPEATGMPLGRMRGKLHRYRGIPVVVSYHPAYLLRAPGEKAKAWADLCFALQARKDAA